MGKRPAAMHLYTSTCRTESVHMHACVYTSIPNGTTRTHRCRTSVSPRPAQKRTPCPIPCDQLRILTRDGQATSDHAYTRVHVVRMHACAHTNIPNNATRTHVLHRPCFSSVRHSLSHTLPSVQPLRPGLASSTTQPCRHVFFLIASRNTTGRSKSQSSLPL